MLKLLRLTWERLMLEIRNLNVIRNGLQVLWDVSLNVKKNEIVALIGSNGAGKTTFLSTLVGLLKPSSGTMLFNDKEISGLPPYKNVNLGISFVPEDRKLFSNCSVRENLLLGAYSSRAKTHTKDMLNAVYQIFPLSKARENQLSVTLSGGEQRMLAIARGLMSNPELLILDEPSQGLSPKMAVEVFKALQKLKERDISILLAEQNVYHALKFADRVYVMEMGKVTLEGKSSELLGNDYVREAFLGL
jgi:branched-chain amino acid transport system ATP-binding protein